jgi:hypothetical protein
MKDLGLGLGIPTVFFWAEEFGVLIDFTNA